MIKKVDKVSQSKDVLFGVQVGNSGWPIPYELTLLAEKLGFDSVSVADQFTWYTPEEECWDAWAFISYVAAKTRRIRFTQGVTCPHYCHPAVLARTLATIDMLSNGRLILGIAAGEKRSMDPYGIPCDRPALRLKEALKIIKSLWTEDVVNFDGTFFKIQNAYLPMKRRLAQKPRPPIWVGAESHYTKRVVSELADGWITVMKTPETFKEEIRKIRHTAEKDYDREGEDILPTYMFGTAISEDYDAAVSLMKIERALFTFMGSKYLKWLGVKIEKDFEPIGTIEQPLVTGEDVPFEAVEKTMPFGTVDTCVDLLEKFVKAGCRYFVIGPHGSFAQQKHSLEIYAKEIIPRISMI